MACNYIYLSRWKITPLEHPPGSEGKFQVDYILEDARTGAAAVARLHDIYPQYRDLPCTVECVVPARKGVPQA